MIIVRYRGGLGNQMFQYAFQTALGNCYPQEIIKADISHYMLQEEHNGFELDRVFPISLRYADAKEVKNLTNLYVATPFACALPPIIKKKLSNHYQYTISEYKKKIFKQKNENYYREKYHNSFEEVVLHLNLSHDWYLDGLWQNQQYFKKCEKQLFQAFAFPSKELLDKEDKILLQQIDSEKSVGVHVRRGDFVKSKFDLCNFKYYKAAMQLIEHKLEQPKYFFFTDDEEFVEKEFAYIENKKIVSHPVENSIIDMQMMSSCKHNIISNSTFSYWSAFLNTSPMKMVIAPCYSIINKVGAFELSAPEEWIKIEV